jgi:5-methylcytosine-specific restriction endonuclease McrA
MPPDPKPPRRIKDPDLMRRMHLEGGVCCVCGVSYGLELDHIVRRSQGGDDTRENLRWLCKRHHQELHAGNLQIP